MPAKKTLPAETDPTPEELRGRTPTRPDWPEAIRHRLTELPPSPGCYLMKDDTGKVLYIGKASNLRNRVRSYFSNFLRNEPRIQRMTLKIADIEVIAVENEVEALVLEANLVHRHLPRYNVALKDDKHYPYVKVTTEESYPRILITRRRRNDGGTYFGPYPNGAGMRQTLDFLQKTYRLRTCKIAFPTSEKIRPCLLYFIKRCDGPCNPKGIEHEEYLGRVKEVLLFLSGKRTELRKRIEERMETAAEALEFEQAVRWRDALRWTEEISRRQTVDVTFAGNCDVIGLARQDLYGVVVAIHLNEGIMIGREQVQVHVPLEEPPGKVLYDFLLHFYEERAVPAEIFLSEDPEDAESLEKWLVGKRGSKLDLRTPKRGDKTRLVALAERNASLLLTEMLAARQRAREKIPHALEALARDLFLDKPPLRIECFDISNLQGTNMVASMVVFLSGKPARKEYRHFHIKTVTDAPNDFAAMQEVVARRYARVKADSLPPPDLVLVDGGPGQLTSGLKALREVGMEQLRIASLAKKREEVFLPDRAEPLLIPRTSSALKLLQEVRDEAHRFAITFHRKVRSKNTFVSEVDKITGIGPKARAILFEALGSLEAIREAPLEKLVQVKGITARQAKAVRKYFEEPPVGKE